MRVSEKSPPPHVVDYSRLEQTAFQPAELRSLRLAVVGAGALGNQVVQALGLLGAGAVTIIDHDRVEPSNLTCSVLFRSPGAAGQPKAGTLAATGARLFPDTQFSGFSLPIAGVGFAELTGADLLFGCVDNDLARLEIAYLARQLGLPVCDGGLGGEGASRGRVSWFPGGAAACFGCLLRNHTRQELFTRWESQPQPCWTPRASEGETSARASTPTMAAIVGSMQVEIGLRRWSDLRKGSRGAEQARSFEISLQGEPRLEAVELRRNARCPLHEPVSHREREERSGETALDLLRRAATRTGRTLERAALLLDWPLCMSARCEDCSLEWKPWRRVGALRAGGRCPRCGSQYLEVRETLHSIRADSPWAGRPLRKLGLPARHLHAVVWEDPNSS